MAATTTTTSRTASDDAKHVFDWFGDAGCFLGGTPFGEGYDAERVTNPLTTPFERLYVNAKTRDVALRVRPNVFKEKRLSDAMGILLLYTDMKDPANDVVLYPFHSQEDVPEAERDMKEAELSDDFIRLV